MDKLELDTRKLHKFQVDIGTLQIPNFSTGAGEMAFCVIKYHLEKILDVEIKEASKTWAGIDADEFVREIRGELE